MGKDDAECGTALPSSHAVVWARDGTATTTRRGGGGGGGGRGGGEGGLHSCFGGGAAASDEDCRSLALCKSQRSGGGVGVGVGGGGVGGWSAAPAASLGWRACPVARLYVLLRHVDAELESSASLWSMIEAVFDTVQRKEEQVSLFVDFARTSPSLAPRFQQRLLDYATFWRRISQLVEANLSSFPDPHHRSFAIIQQQQQQQQAPPPPTAVARGAPPPL